ncbi:MAG TPA: hypothetical protein VNM44_15865, partial [Gaiella sp.]|nr:hypothetical protein [Gaiella sp.]
MSALTKPPNRPGHHSLVASEQTLPDSQTAVVRAEHLSKRFGDLCAVDDLTFSLKPGTVTGFLGPNGA